MTSGDVVCQETGNHALDAHREGLYASRKPFGVLFVDTDGVAAVHADIVPAQ